MVSRILQRRTVLLPTRLGWLILLVVLGAPLLSWCFLGENFLAHTERLPAEVLIVEGWIGIGGISAAKEEFDRGGYRYVVTTGGLVSTRTGGNDRWNYAVDTRKRLIRLGLSPEAVIEAPAGDTVTNRTFEAACAVARMLEARGLHPASANIFSFSAHARRTRLVFVKVLPHDIRLGVVAWKPAEYMQGPWWKSSERIEEFVKETVAYSFEFLLNSGRWSNSTAEHTP